MSKYKPYPKYKESGVAWLGEVPEHWEIQRGKFIFEEKNRSVRDIDEIVTVFRDGQVILRSKRRTKGFTLAILEHGYQGIRKGDLVIHSMDAFAGAIGVSEDDGRSTPEYVVVKPFIENSHDEEYYANQLKIMAQRGFIYILCPSVRERAPRYRFARFSETNLLSPPYKEQILISQYIKEKTQKIDTLIEKQQTLIKLLKEKRQALVDKALNESDIKHIALKQLIERIYRPVYRDKNETYTTLGLYNRGRGLFHRDPKEEEELGESDFYWVEDKDLIISGQFSWEGAIALAKKSENRCIVSHRFPIVRGKENILNTEYLWAFFTTQLGDFILNEHSVGSAGRNRPLNMNTLVKEKIPLPSMEAQLKVAKVVQIEQQIHIKIKREIELLKERRTALISAVVTGKVDVRDAKILDIIMKR